MAATAKRIHFDTEIPAIPPSPGKAYLVLELEGFSEAGIHGFIRVAEGLAPLMGQSKLPLKSVEKVTRATARVVEILEDGLGWEDGVAVAALVNELKR